MSRKGRTVGLVIIIIGAIIGLHYLGWLTRTEIAVRGLIDQPTRFLYRLAIPKLGQANSSVTSPVGANQGDQCAPESASIQRLEEENNALRDQLHFLKISPTYVGADVIGRNIDPIGTTIVVNRGARDGILVGNPVIVGRGLIVGEVARVDATTSVVRLLSDNQSKIGATVSNHDKSLGIVEGGFGIAVRLNFIPQNEIVRPGDVVITSGLEANVPRGLSIGTVEVVEKNPQEPFQQAILKPLADLHALTVVSIITNF